VRQPQEWTAAEGAELAREAALEGWRQQQQQQQLYQDGDDDQQQQLSQDSDVGGQEGVAGAQARGNLKWAELAEGEGVQQLEESKSGQQEALAWLVQQQQQHGTGHASQARQGHRQRVLDAIGRELTSQEEWDWKVGRHLRSCVMISHSQLRERMLVFEGKHEGGGGGQEDHSLSGRTCCF